MSFQSFTAQALTYQERGAGEYHLSTASFADPANYIRLRPGAIRKDGNLSFGYTRVIEKDVVVGSDTVRKPMLITTNVVIPSDGSFTAAEIDSAHTDLSEIMTVDQVSRQAQGES